jgi:hypothetical protein
MVAQKEAIRIKEKIPHNSAQKTVENGWGNLFDLSPNIDNISGAFGAIAPPYDLADNVITSHSSLQRFNVDAAVIEELMEFIEKEKACAFEPNGKPCDKCAMCSARGF